MGETIEGLPLLCDYQLPQDEVHVWRIGLDWSPERVQAMNAVLSLDERQKANRFRFDQDRTRHVVGRGVPAIDTRPMHEDRGGAAAL